MHKLQRPVPKTPEGERPLERSKCRREDNIKMDIRKTGVEGVDWVHLAQDRDRWQAFVNTVMKVLVP
jgi:hypothetical protein